MSDQNSPEPRGLMALNGWWAASGFVILLVILGVVYILVWGTGNDPEPAAQPGATSSSSTPSTDTDEPPTDDQEPLTAAPEATTWESFHGVINLPVSASAGPSTQDGPIWSGWSRTATGALMAATYLAAGSDGPEAATVMETHSIDGPAARAYIAKVTAAPPRDIKPGTTAAVGGFRFVTYSPDAAKVELLMVGPGVSFSLPVDLTWQDGDWRINFEPAGGKPIITEIGGPSGFIPWSAE